MNCSVLALSAVFCSGLLTCSADSLFITVIHCTTSKESMCRIICMLCQQTSPKRWFASVNMTSYCDVTNSVYTVTMTTIRLCSILKFSCRAYNQAVVPDITRLLHATALVQEIHFLLGNSYNQAVVPDITRLLHATALVQEIHFLLGNSV